MERERRERQVCVAQLQCGSLWAITKVRQLPPATHSIQPTRKIEPKILPASTWQKPKENRQICLQTTGNSPEFAKSLREKRPGDRTENLPENTRICDLDLHLDLRLGFTPGFATWIFEGILGLKMFNY